MTIRLMGSFQCCLRVVTAGIHHNLCHKVHMASLTELCSTPYMQQPWCVTPYYQQSLLQRIEACMKASRTLLESNEGIMMDMFSYVSNQFDAMSALDVPLCNACHKAAEVVLCLPHWSLNLWPSLWKQQWLTMTQVTSTLVSWLHCTVICRRGL